MCGICGIAFSRADQNVDEGMLTQMTSTLHHRGPDGAGYHLDGGIGLGHRRLSIIDIDGGDQPMYNDDKRVAIVFNGEIYNYKELRADLKKRGHQFHTQSDTEVIIRLYEEKGVACLDDLNGMFAFALWDKQERQLFIARDRLGEKPLYYHLEKNGNRESLVFGSELKALITVPWVPRDVSYAAVDDYLAYGYVPAPRTILEGVKKLEAAQFLLFKDGEIDIKTYWRSRLSKPSQRRADGDYLNEFKDLLSDSIRMRLRSDVPVGAFLSGGIDSSLIVAMASKLSASQLTTFSISFGESGFDESPFAREVATQYGTDHREVRLAPLELSLFPDLVRQFDEPFADPSSLPTYLITKAAGNELKVCLSGDAGDELFGGYSQYRAEPLEGIVDAVPAVLREFTLGKLARVMPRGAKGHGWLSRMSVDGARRYQRTQGIFDDAERLSLWRPEFSSHVDTDAWLFAKHYDREQFGRNGSRMMVDQNTYLADDILVKVDRDAMFNSLEVRVPLLDHRIVEFANQLPENLKIRDGVQKFLLKELLRDMVSESILTRPKRGFGMPLERWFKNEYRDYFQDMMLSKDSVSAQFFDQAFVGQLFNAHVDGSRNLSHRLWGLLWFEQWCREFLSTDTFRSA